MVVQYYSRSGTVAAEVDWVRGMHDPNHGNDFERFEKARAQALATEPGLKEMIWGRLVSLCSWRRQNTRERMEKCTNVTGWKAYLSALRPWMYPMSLYPCGLGFLLALQDTGNWSWLVAIITVLVVLSVLTAGNLVNTYDDFMQRSAQRERQEMVRRMGTLAYAMGVLLFVVLTWLSRAHYLRLSIVFFVGLSGSFLYTNGPAGLKYIGIGDLVIVMTFGPLTAIFSYLSMGGFESLRACWNVFLLSLPLAMLAEAALHSNNTRDVDVDRARGMITLPILLGRGWSWFVYCCLLIFPFIILVILMVRCSVLFALPLVTLQMALNVEKEFRLGNFRFLPNRTMYFHSFFGALYVPLFYFVEKARIF